MGRARSRSASVIEPHRRQTRCRWSTWSATWYVGEPCCRWVCETTPSPSSREISTATGLLNRCASSELTAGDIRLDTRSGKVTRAGEPVKLTAQEYKLLSYLLHHKGKVVSRTELIEHIYDQDFDRDSNTIEVFVTRIRKKLGQDVITTIRGLGYSLEDPDA